MISEYRFVCDMCGECCRHIDLIKELSDMDSGNGICKYLDGNKCSIYETRPDECNVSKMYENRYKDIMSLEEYYKLNYEGCSVLKKKYRINT